MAGTLFLGTSGFSFDQWKGPFYPEKIKQRDVLPFYASRFPSVEINLTFRRDVAETTVETWRDSTPESFRFTLKAHQRITHFFRLANCAEPLSTFLDRAKILGPRLGAILFQCPPNMKFERQRLETFLASLPPMCRYAFEFRHASWEEGRDALASNGAAWCVADTDEVPITNGTPISSDPFAYLRLRRTEYSEDEIHAWAKRITAILEDDRDVYCYFKHEEKGAGPIYAERLADLIS
jgi:uncharacterized protein YecE (DUF72 family)